MDAKQLAEMLNGIEYRDVTGFRQSATAAAAKRDGLVIAYGYSDDLLEFDGGIYDEAEAPGTVLIDPRGPLPTWEQVSEEEDEAADYIQRKANAKAITAIWNNCPDDGRFAWTLQTDIPHTTFSIVEDGQPFSQGIVFHTSDLLNQKED